VASRQTPKNYWAVVHGRANTMFNKADNVSNYGKKHD